MRVWIENGNIFATEDRNVNIPFQVFEFPDDTKLEHLKVVNGRIVLKSQNEIEAESFEKLKKQKFDEFKSKVREIENLVIGKYPESERLSWFYKVEEARKIVDGDFSSSNLITEELSFELNRNPTQEDILNRASLILEKYETFGTIAAKIASLRRRIENATNIRELEEIDLSELNSFIEDLNG